MMLLGATVDSILPLNWWKMLLVVMVAGLWIWVIKLVRDLLSMEKYMKTNLKNWLEIRKRLKEDPGLLETTIKRELQT